MLGPCVSAMSARAFASTNAGSAQRRSAPAAVWWRRKEWLKDGMLMRSLATSHNGGEGSSDDDEDNGANGDVEDDVGDGDGNGESKAAGLDDDDDDDGDDDDDDDEFDSFDFEDFDESETLEKIQETPDNMISPLLAQKFVDQLVSRTSQQVAQDLSPSFKLSKFRLTRHMLEVFAASLITTFTIEAHTNFLSRHPLETKVYGHIALDELELSAPAEAALRALVTKNRFLKKPRVVRMVCMQFATRAENMLQVMHQMEAVVRAARESVGETVDTTEVRDVFEVIEYLKSMPEMRLSITEKRVLERFLKYETSTLAEESAEFQLLVKKGQDLEASIPNRKMMLQPSAAVTKEISEIQQVSTQS